MWDGVFTKVYHSLSMCCCIVALDALAFKHQHVLCMLVSYDDEATEYFKKGTEVSSAFFYCCLKS